MENWHVWNREQRMFRKQRREYIRNTEQKRNMKYRTECSIESIEILKHEAQSRTEQIGMNEWSGYQHTDLKH